jgi:hypothetical protein
MRRQLTILIALAGAALPVSRASAQHSDHMARGGMMGMGHDSATMAQMSLIHELVVNHEKIRRTVTNLADGIRTVTESDDAAVAQLIKAHVTSMMQRVREGSDPGLPMESPALHAIFQNKEKIRTTVELTDNGAIVLQMSTDEQTIAALQKHAAEVTDLTRGGMAAMHEAMMKNGGRMHGGMQGGMMPAGAQADHADHAQHTGHAADAAHAGTTSDSAFAALQMRGKQAMGVDQYTSTHRFDALPDGGRIELQRDSDDPEGVAQIRQHLQEIAKAFSSGDFSTPAFVHMRQVPGTDVMAARRDAITWTFRELPRGGELRIVTRDPAALEAIHAFLAFQRQDHRAGGMEHGKTR